MTNPELIPGDVVVCRNATHMFIGCGGEPNSFGFMKLWFLSKIGYEIHTMVISANFGEQEDLDQALMNHNVVLIGTDQNGNE